MIVLSVLEPRELGDAIMAGIFYSISLRLGMRSLRARLNLLTSRSNNSAGLAALRMGRAANRAYITATHQVGWGAWNPSRYP